MDALELGSKLVFNRKLQINSSIFYYNYKNLQIPLPEPAPPGPLVTEIINLPKVVTYGAEFETLWAPIANLQLALDYSYLHARIKESPEQNNAVSGQFENVVGNTVPESPTNKVAANANYTWHFVPGALNYSVSYIWKDKTNDSIFSESYYVAPSYSQIDMRLSWNDAADKFTVFGYVKNLQNKLGYDAVGAYGVTQAAPGTAACGVAAGANYYCDQELRLTPPRTYGVQVQYRLK